MADSHSKGRRNAAQDDGPVGSKPSRGPSREYVRVSLVWLPLLRAAMDQPNATPTLAREVERILAELPEDLQP
jgi:hypothetical protein